MWVAHCFFDLVSCNSTQYRITRKWSNSYKKVPIGNYEEMDLGRRNLCFLNKVNSTFGSLGRNIAYRFHEDRRRKLEEL